MAFAEEASAGVEVVTVPVVERAAYLVAVLTSGAAGVVEEVPEGIVRQVPH